MLPLITPFDERGEVDVAMLRRLTAFYVASDVQAIFAIGSAGQGPVMTHDQRRLALEIIIEGCKPRVPVVAHVGTADAFSSRDLARHAAACGVDAIAIVPPYYYSDHTEFEIICHFCEVAEAAPGLPIVVYDNPKYSGIQLSPSLLLELRQRLPDVSGMKVAFARLEQMLAYVEQVPGLKVYAGSIQHLAAGVPRGIAGAINPPSSFFPELCVQLWRAVCAGRHADARELQARVNALSTVVADFTQRFGRGTFAEVLRLRGFPVTRYPRWTTHVLSGEERQQLRQALLAAGAGPSLS